MFQKYLSILIVISIASIVLSTSVNEVQKETVSLKDANPLNNLKLAQMKETYVYETYGYDDYYCYPYDYNCDFYNKRR